VTGTPRLQLRLPAGCHRRILAHCCAALPIEACGLLLGRREGGLAEVSEVSIEINTRAATDRYEIAPEAVLAAVRSARSAGRQLIGAWHSHPGGAPVPSATDRDEAWPDWIYLIVGLADPARPELRAWRLLGEDFVEDELEIA
jgi:proteasome lid subunit RPN8/RPN11